MNKLRAYCRAYRGYCPACNLDAPAIDRCQVCLNYRGVWPPSQFIRAMWLAEYFKRLELDIPMDYKAEDGSGDKPERGVNQVKARGWFP